MYLSRVLIRNSGAITQLEFEAPFRPDGTPKPVIFVGANGVGKTDLLSIIADALIEIAAHQLQDVTPHSGQHRSYFRIVGGRNQKLGAQFSLSALKFMIKTDEIYYLAKSGRVNASSLATELENFKPIANWGEEGNEKRVSIPNVKVADIFSNGAYAFFPSTRFELPHWANLHVLDRDPDADFTPKFADKLNKPIVVQSAVRSIKPWILDVMLDGSVNVNQILAADNLNVLKAEVVQNLTSFHLSYQSLNSIISAILGKPARFARTNRSFLDRRIGIAEGKSLSIPSLDHLSAGQSTLLAVFGTIARYGDTGQAGVALNQVEGIAIVDEIDAHLHADLQHDALPSLMKLFPKVQFIVSSHSPLLPLGMRKLFGDDGFSLIEMPSGAKVDAERFSEFEASFAYLRATGAFEKAVQEKVRHGKRPIILSEGETDPKYLRTAAELLGITGLLESVDFDWIGRKETSGAFGGGKSHLDDARKLLTNNPQFVTRKIVLLYDSDAGCRNHDIGDLHIRSLPLNMENSIRKRGIENLLPDSVFMDRFFVETVKNNGDDQIKRRSLNKTALCSYLCDERRDVNNFEKFREPLLELEDLLTSKAPNSAETRPDAGSE